jgi:pimeloyl-ACP methyl ester carboxylesterase
MHLPVRFVLASLLLATAAPAAPAPSSYGPELQGFAYPAPVHRYQFTSQDNALQMAFMDVAPAHPNGRTIVLLHGKNFCAATWEQSITVLSAAGYRVVAPDQIGFCKSSKPARYQFSFEQLAANTQALLHSIGVQHAIIAGHSTGGMLAIRYALMYPGEVDQLVLVDPIGLEDWQAKGVPWTSIDSWYRDERETDAAGIRAYERSTYYAGQWKPEYERWVDMLAGMYAGPGRDAVAWDSALIYDMIFDQPVIHDLPRLQAPTLLIVGDKDTTAIGKQFAPQAVRETLGDYPVLANAAAQAIPHATLVEFPDAGHAPQIQDPDAFHKTLLDWLAKFPPHA